MKKLKTKEQHEQLLANADREKIVQLLNNDRAQDVTPIAVALARQCALFVHFQRLWRMRVSDLDEKLSTERYTKHIFVNKGSQN
jgi:hypothetical protein